MLGPKIAVKDRPRVSVDPIDVNAPRAKGSSDQAEKEFARPDPSLVTPVTVRLKVAEDGMWRQREIGFDLEYSNRVKEIVIGNS